MNNLLMDIPLWDFDTPEELLGIDENNPEGDDDFWQHGWGIVEDSELFLMGSHNSLHFIPRRAIVFILHSTDDPPKQDDDIEIGFWIDNEDISYLEEEIEARTSLNKFLKLRLDEIIEKCKNENIKDLILCVCNPHCATIQRPQIVPDDINVYFPKGIVEHWKITTKSQDRKVPRLFETRYELRAEESWKLL